MKTRTFSYSLAIASLVACGLLFAFSNVQFASAASTLFGDASIVSGGNPGNAVQIRSDSGSGDGFGGVRFDDANGTLFSSLSTLSTDYNVTDDDCGAGSPRVQIRIDVNGSGVSDAGDGNLFAYIGPSPNFTDCATGWQSTGNLIGNNDTGRWDSSQIPGGSNSGTYAQALTAAGAFNILSISIVDDSSFSANATGGDGEMTTLLDNITINSTTYDFPPAPPASPVTVTIVKYVDGVHATEANAASSTFPFTATYNATNTGSGSDPFTIGPTGNNTPNAYEAKTIPLASGADYKAEENTSGNDVVGASCADGKPFALTGYSSGNTLGDAQSASTTPSAPAFTGLTSDKYVITWNETCATTTEDVSVTIVKYVGGVHATAANASSTPFPMVSSWDATNLGGAGSGTYTLSTTGFNTPNAYEAVTSDMTSGSDYSTSEDTSTSVVGPNCSSGQAFRLVGYTTGDTLAQAQAGSPSTTTPTFTNFTTDKYVIVWNEPCASTPPGPTEPPANACDSSTTPGGFTRRNGTSGNDNVTLAPNTMFVGRGGNDRVTAPDGNYIICTGGGNDSITIGAGNSTIDAGGGNNRIETGNGNQTISTNSGNDSITTGTGNHTITAGGGNNKVTTGDGTQNVTAGSGNDSITTGNDDDTISAGGGNNTVKSNGGTDSLSAGSGNDKFDGGSGTDTCNPGGGNNSVVNCEL